MSFDSIARSVGRREILVARTVTGDVTFTSFTGDAALGGGIRLETGVDERGVPLAANAIVLPRSVDFLPASLIVAAQRVLGQAFSVATAPAEALPEGVLFVRRQTVIDRGVELAEAGERIKFGEPSTIVQDLWLGRHEHDSRRRLRSDLRTTKAGKAFLTEVAAILGPDEAARGTFDYQRQFAQAASRSGHLSAIASSASGTPPTLIVTSGSSGRSQPGGWHAPSCLVWRLRSATPAPRRVLRWSYPAIDRPRSAKAPAGSRPRDRRARRRAGRLT